jgi:hypothetical protein
LAVENIINLKQAIMTTTQKMLIKKAEINQQSKKSMIFIVIGTSILFIISAIAAWNTFGLQTLL